MIITINGEECRVISNAAPGYFVSINGNIYSCIKKNEMKKLVPQKTKKGYLTTHIKSKNNFKLTKVVHRIVALNFIENPYKLPEVNHINGNKIDNRVENLEWVTAKQNTHHAYKIGLKKFRVGDYGGNLKVKWADIKTALALHKRNGGTLKTGAIAKMLGLTPQYITDLLRGDGRSEQGKKPNYKLRVTLE